MAVSVVSFSFFRAAQPEAQGLSFLLSAGFLYHILSATSLDPNSIGCPEGSFGLAWLSLPHLISNLSPTVWHFVLTELYNSSTPTQSPTRSLEWHVWSSSRGNNCHAVDRSLSAECWLSLPHLVSNFSGPQLNRGPRGLLRPGEAFPTTSYQQLISNCLTFCLDRVI